MRGFTLIELVIVVIIVALLGLVVIGGWQARDSGASVSFGLNGVVEHRCIDGLKFVIGQRGDARQVYDQLGRGVACNEGP